MARGTLPKPLTKKQGGARRTPKPTSQPLKGSVYCSHSINRELMAQMTLRGQLTKVTEGGGDSSQGTGRAAGRAGLAHTLVCKQRAKSQLLDANEHPRGLHPSQSPGPDSLSRQKLSLGKVCCYLSAAGCLGQG